ncbi:MAG: hypothetical protein ACI4II_06725 [Acutalibacteraceae bacterium]
MNNKRIKIIVTIAVIITLILSIVCFALLIKSIRSFYAAHNTQHDTGGLQYLSVYLADVHN